MAAPSPDVIIIGSGVVGCSIALELARDGMKVCVVERGPGPGYGSTSASSAVVRFNYSTWTGVAAAWESRQLWEVWAEHLGCLDDGRVARFVRTGGLHLDTPDQDAEKVLHLFERAHIPFERWDAATIHARIPSIAPGRFYPPKNPRSDEFWDGPQGELSGFWTPDAGFVDDPQFATHNLKIGAEHLGADFRFKVTVSGVTRRGGRVAGVTLSDGASLDAPIVVNAAGPHSAHINELADVLDDFSVSTRPLRQEVHHVPAPPGYGDVEPGPLVADLDLGTYFRGTPQGGLLVGGTEPACDPLHWLDDPDDYDGHVTAEAYEAQVYRAARRLPDLTVPNKPQGIAGVYDVSDDWIPIYDRTGLPGYYVAIGTSGNQFKNAPVIGRFLATIIEACENGHDHDSSPVQLTLSKTGLTVDLGHYSRKREVNQASSFGVMG